MTTQDFIERNFDVEQRLDKRFSSVMVDTKGAIYSYGYHYPLLFKIEGLAFVNVTGHSATTRRHILWAKQAYPDAIPVRLAGATICGATAKDMADIIQVEVDANKARIEYHKSKGRRTDTKVFKEMLDKLSESEERLAIVNNYVGGK